MTEADEAKLMLDYLSTNIIGRPGVPLSADSSLIKSGLIDSFALIDILMKLEDITNMRIPAGKVQPKDLDTVHQMLATARRVGKPR